MHKTSLLSPLPVLSVKDGRNLCSQKPLRYGRENRWIKTTSESKSVQGVDLRAKITHTPWFRFSQAALSWHHWSLHDSMSFMQSFNSSSCHCCPETQGCTFSHGIDRFYVFYWKESIMLILYLLLACPQSFVISLLVWIWCNVMKCLRAALGACLAEAIGVGAPSRSPLKHIPLSECVERGIGGWEDWGGGGVGGSLLLGDSLYRTQTEGQWDPCRSRGRDHPLRWQHPLNLITLRSFSLHMDV